ncbi:MAG: hypothetical protein JNL74_04280 [Fibrobacteres bacterium]|nr:hypothetical protein [Fibrobacterota bacterium]
MTSKERVLCAIERKAVDRVAIDFHAKEEVVEALARRLNVRNYEEVENRLGSDLRRIRPSHPSEVSPMRYADPTVAITSDGLYRDIWGVGFKANQTSNGLYMDLADSPLAYAGCLGALHKHKWPSADDLDYSGIYQQALKYKDKWVWFNARGVFEVSWFMRGFENFLADLAAEPEMACYLMDSVLKYQIDRARRILDAGKGLIDMVEYNDDMGTQQNMFISPSMWREYIKPRMARFIQVCKKEYGVKIRYHSCGAISPIIEDLIEIGVDMLNPIQTLATGMQPPALAESFGGRITFNGGIDTQQLLPHASADTVRTDTASLIKLFGPGFVLAPSHRFQSDVPIDNILAVYDTALQHN